MADILDQANETEELDRANALRNRDRGPTITATGKCLCCDEPMPAGQRWCDADCRDTWELHNRRR